jgi:RNA polymerase sigma-70 factor, ECF subfamily
MRTSHTPLAADDADVILRSLDEPRAFGIVFDRHFGAVHAYAQRRGGNELADEIAAETFARAFDLRGRYRRSQPSARPWLLGIATNLLRRHWRTERRRLAAYARSAAVEPAEDVPSSLAVEALEAVAALGRHERDVLLLYAWADLSYEEIALALDVPVGTVRSRLSRARRRLAASVEPPWPHLLPIVKEPTNV